ncbi:deoxyribonuclease IV [Staphylococcus agnetis]|uniref:deoxyribonuclease IV n=1 Tax=Staphylococcus agnetis TaxID=985762 RepID=UPI0004E3E189|nr:deoxyribonuclease IV [Staphylococcus agnetis]KFE42178.1 endonuclease IV [Staphylococcus agnetis]NJH64871.1 deoxyribonuclease IV [Staphylococcus agnetis]NJH97383.1 deoxyribonuclease IV [Staphylococcus agnetis]PTH44124.1 deoxyribonuclease IV [Staphylococcus agnetis]PTH72486.1 deoxyribonuclease IV [Staphylococcus agnetis]
MLIGSHVSMSGKKMLQASAEEAHKYGASTFMIYTGAPQNTRRKAIEELNIEAGQKAMQAYGLSNIVVHAPYIINIANTSKPEVFELGVNFLQNEIERTEAIGAKDIVLHPGSHVGAGAEVGIKRIIEGLNEVLTNKNDVRIALETMAGKGSEVGRTFEEIARIIDGVTHNERLSVCLDTCHIHDAGYDVVNDFDGVLNEFDKIIGVDRIKVVHVNDSKNPREAHKDRHENIGFGHIGFDALNYVVHHKQFEHIPKILETPYVGDDKKNKKPPYKFEIEALKAGKFDPEMKDKIMAQN